MILLPSVRLAPGEPESRLRPLAARALGVPVSALGEIRIVRKSLDARRKRDIHWQYALACACEQEAKVLARGFSAWTPPQYAIPKARSDTRPVVVGFGPAGIFAALLLAEAELRPVVLERGAPVEQRSAAVQRFWEGGELSPEANVQFGEGGAGAFSDGKLTTGTHDGRIPFVLSQLRRFGAPEQIEYDAKPHVGTDVLRRVVRNLREHIRSLGGEICFQSSFIGFDTDAAGRVCAVRAETPEGPVTLPCRDLLLAPGHSARDTFELLRDLGLPMERKAFAMGVRIEHRQADINAAQYGPFARNLPPADYKLSVRLPDGRGVFTFCMCPGGYVVASSSERGGVVTNGMSYSGRAGENANAALLVSIRPADFPEAGGVLAGMEWQRAIERQCFRCGGGNYHAPAQTVGDFLGAAPDAVQGGAVSPSYRPGVHWTDLRDALPPLLTDALAQALPLLGQKLRGFDAPDAVLTAPETRSSSPVRILRDDRLQSPAVPGLYPCGEGAGYAGGITSAAVDGLRCAERILEQYRV